MHLFLENPRTVLQRNCQRSLLYGKIKERTVKLMAEIISEYGAIEPWEEATISNSVMFRLVMERPHLCQKLLERLLNIKITEMSSPQFEKDYREDMTSKGIRLDIFVKDADGVAIDVEMQAVSKSMHELGRRARYYQSVMDHNLLGKNVSYTELRKSYIIFICTFDPYGQRLPIYTFTNICHETSAISLCDDTTKIFFNATGPREKLTPEQANLMIYVNGGPATDDFTHELDAEVMKYRQSTEKRAIYMTYEQELLSAKAAGRFEGMVEGKREGRLEGKREGRLEGRLEGRIELLKDMVRDGLLTIKEAAQRAGISEELFKQKAML